jgi:choline dehydrogenase-like flavoprotein
MAQSYLIDAHRKGARIAAEVGVSEIVWRDDPQGDKQVADGVQVVLADGRSRFIRARKGVVIAAGTMASSCILAASGIEGTGEGISLNIASPVAALMPEDRPVRAWDEDQMATYVDRGDFLIESHFQPPMSMASLLSGWFGEHARRMQNYSRIASAGILFPADRRGRLVGGRLSFKLQADIDLPLIRRALAALVRVHFAAGAIEVYPPVLRGVTILPDDDIEAVLEDVIREADDVVLSSSHPHGGNAMNVDPENGVVDVNCRVHGTTNVLVTDASVLPSCIRVNAQLTTMAMAHYATARADPFAA